MLTNLFFISDTVGNLIAFSDGTFSGETADHDEVEMEELPKKTVSIISMITAPEPLRYQNRPDRKCRNPCQSLCLPSFVQFLSLPSFIEGLFVWIEWSGFEPWPGTLSLTLTLARRFTLTVPLYTQVYERVLANLILGGNPAMDEHPI